MGNTLHSIFRSSGGEKEEDEVPYRLYYNRVPSRRSNQDYHHPRKGVDLSSTFWGRLRENMLRLCKAIDNVVKVIQRKLRRIISWFLRLKKSVAQDPVLPLRNPAAPSIVCNSSTLLKDPLLISSVSSSSSDYYAELPSDISCADDSVDVSNCQQWPEGIINYSDTMQQTDDKDNRVLVYIPQYASYSVAGTTANHVANQKDNEQSSSKEEVKIIHQVTKEIVHQVAKTKTSTVVDESKSEENKQLEQQHQQHITIKKRARAVVNEGRWIKHYSSRHRILIVGDGDFSFSACLALAFGCASNMIATSLDSKEFLKKNYQKALSNINELKGRGCEVMHRIDATKMANHELLGHLTFDRIIFNFPFAGFFKDLSREAQLRRHRRLVSLFLKNAKEMISENGEIHISHKTNGFHSEWMLESMASSHRLRLIEAVNFNHRDYPGYNTKCGFGSDNNFNCYPSKTYKFGLKMVR